MHLSPTNFILMDLLMQSDVHTSRRKTMQLYHVHFMALLISYQQYLLKCVEASCPVKEVHDPERRFAVFERRIVGMIKPSSQCSTAGDSSFASVARSTIVFFSLW